MKNTIILFSGGIDSLAMLTLALQQNIKPILLHIQYDHPAAQKELEAVIKIQKKFANSCKLHLHKLAINSNEMFIGPGVKGPRIVQGRNIMFIALAYNLGSLYFGRNHFYTWIGANKIDQIDYYDCSSNFLHIANLLFPNMGLYAPLILRDKKEILGMTKKEDQLLSWSCYQPKNNYACGTCNSCLQYNGILSK
tara:strand:+ start:842 stop:1423 length:582 start_codon:yes stop_codon:yes gene_type:complete